MNLWLSFSFLLCCFYFLLCEIESHNGSRRLFALKSQVYEAHQERLEKAWTQCSVNPQSPLHKTMQSSLIPSDASTRYRRSITYNAHEHVRATNTWGVHLLGEAIGTLLKTTHSIVPSGNFTIELWIKPEGGQHNPTVLLAAKDRCSSIADKGWELGIHSTEGNGERIGHLYFQLQTVQDTKVSTLYAAIPYKPTIWSYITITYDGEVTILYVDGTQVAISRKSQGRTFRKYTSFSCNALLLGGSEENTTFRGLISQLRLWDQPMTQSYLKKMMHNYKSQISEPGLVFEETFINLDEWEWLTSTATHLMPRVVAVSLPSKKYDLLPHSPPCGFTVCDDQDIITSYSQNHEMRPLRKIRYQIVNVRNSDGSNPTVSSSQIAFQHQALQNAFLPYNISFELSQLDVANTSLRRRTVIFGCSPWNVGNGVCNPECNFKVTSFDGGDCRDTEKMPLCVEETIGNGHCNEECNVFMHDWDRGDCCNVTVTDTAKTCVDPYSPFRAYMDESEFKRILHVKCDHHLTVFFARWTNKEILGVATFPWEKEVFTELGGIILRPADFGVEGHTDTLVHEVGHALGLWHVHRGISEVECGDPCFEREASLVLGDLCQDTNPTPANPGCQDPPTEVALCRKEPFRETPFKNYMGYADDSCTNSFSVQQTARMHCYLDLLYSNWLQKSEDTPAPPPAPPQAPQVLESKETQVKLVWVPPLSDALYLNSFSCHMCTHERALMQYAHSVVSSVQSLSYADAGQPHQATGPPDSEVCTPSTRAWMPDEKLCEDHECSLTLEFPVAVPVSSLSIWVNWNAHMGLANVELLFEDGVIQALGYFSSSCDAPLTLPIFHQNNKLLKKVRLTTNGSYVSVDAVRLVSTPSHLMCSPCKPLKYRVYREPPFSSGPRLEADDTEFTDKEIFPGRDFSYKVQAYFGGIQSPLSPTLVYRHSSPICGDGKTNGQEECDDGNLVSGDGCSRKCTIEKYFNCKGEPSGCYWHQGDGVCELFEENSVVEDCGHFTPIGFSDQWASSVITHSKFYSKLCPPEVILGPPEQKPLVCSNVPNATRAWYPCEMFMTSTFWLRLYFPQPVVATAVIIHLASDGLVSALEMDYSIKVELISLNDSLNFVSQAYLTCANNPLLVPVSHDLSEPFFLTKGIKLTYFAPGVSIAGVQIRSSQFLNPVAIQSCDSSDLYSVSLGKCVKYQCQKPQCPEPYFKNAVWNCNGKEESSQCNITCQEGFMPAGEVDFSQVNSVCLDGEWVGAKLSCIPVDCGLPSIAHADAVCPDGTTYAKTCNFKCRPPARLRGPGYNAHSENGHNGNNGNAGNGAQSSMTAIKCLKLGYWSVPESHCLVSCPPPSAPDHSVLSSSGLACSHLKEPFHFGHRCRFRCKIGYHVQGNSKRRRSFYLTCDSFGSWSGASCLPVSCSLPGNFLGDTPNCTDHLNAGSTCQFHCHGKNEVWETGLCEADGVWNTTFRECPSQFQHGTCSPPQPSLDPTVRIVCDPKYQGSLCQVSCVQFDHEPLISEKAKGLERAMGGKKQLLCSSQGLWIPNPQALVCREKCNRAYIGDGYCDASNNQARCDWDGGDCCASTVKGHVVKPFPSHCTTRCRCMDPDSKETKAKP